LLKHKTLRCGGGISLPSDTEIWLEKVLSIPSKAGPPPSRGLDSSPPETLPTSAFLEEGWAWAADAKDKKNFS